MVGATDAPLDAPLRHRFPDAQALPDLERLALHADRSGADPFAASEPRLEDGDRHAVLGQPAGEGEPDRPRADDR